MKIGAEQAKIEAEIRYLQQKIKEYENENTYLKKELDNYKNFNNRRMLELGEWKERISSGNMFDNPEDLKKSYEEYLRLKKVKILFFFNTTCFFLIFFFCCCCFF